MAKKKDDLEFEYEDEDEATEDEYGEEDLDDEEGDEFDEEDDEDSEEGGKKGGGALKIALLAILFLGAVGAGAFAFMSGGGSLGFLAGVPVVGQFFAEPTPAPIALPTGFVNPNLETRKPATASESGAPAAPAAGATGAVAARPAAPAAPGTAPAAAKPAAPAAAARPAAPAAAARPAVPKAAARPAAPAVAPPAEEPPPVIEQPEQPVSVAARSAEIKKHRARKKPARVAHRRERLERRHRTREAASEGGSGRYSVQVGAFSQPANAERLISMLQAQGYPAFGTGTGRASYGQTGGQFHVRSNVVDSRQKANQLASQFRLAGWSPRIVPLSGGQYVLHLGTFGTQEQANSLVADLNAKGLFATVTGRVGASRAASSAASAAGGPNRVWVGHFDSRAEAEAMASRLRSTVGAAIVVRR